MVAVIKEVETTVVAKVYVNLTEIRPAGINRRPDSAPIAVFGVDEQKDVIVGFEFRFVSVSP